VTGVGLARWASVLVLISIVLTGCGGDDESRLDPPDVEYGVDMAEMGMPVVDPRYTAAILPAGEDEWILFDDVGEFLKYITTRDGMSYDAMWVHDFNDESWVKAEEAWYLESPELTSSPMGWGVATFKDEESALAAQEELGGDLYDWESVRGEAWDRPPGPVD
jgi:hypothetical protein